MSWRQWLRDAPSPKACRIVGSLTALAAVVLFFTQPFDLSTIIAVWALLYFAGLSFYIAGTSRPKRSHRKDADD